MKKEMWDNIEKLSELRSNYSCFDEQEQPYYHALSLGIEGIKALKQTRWIPVSERLPKETGWYLITFKVYDGGYAVCEMSYRKPENYWTRDNICKKVLDNDEVVAWMPLPEPFNAESEVKK